MGGTPPSVDRETTPQLYLQNSCVPWAAESIRSSNRHTIYYRINFLGIVFRLLQFFETASDKRVATAIPHGTPPIASIHLVSRAAAQVGGRQERDVQAPF